MNAKPTFLGSLYFEGLGSKPVDFDHFGGGAMNGEKIVIFRGFLGPRGPAGGPGGPPDPPDYK